MSIDIANWLQVNILGNPQITGSLIALIILVVASFLFSVKFTEKNPFRSRQVLGAVLSSFAIFVFLYSNITDIADVFIAWASMVLAGAAIVSFEESRRLRKQYKEREERDRKERLLNEIIEWVLNVKLSMVHGMAQANIVAEKPQKYRQIFIAISDALLDAELMTLRASENSIPAEEELNNVWHSAFFCSQLAARIAGEKPTDEQRKRWGKNAIDIVTKIDKLEEQDNLTDKELYDGQKDLLEKISVCLKKMVKIEATL